MRIGDRRKRVERGDAPAGAGFGLCRREPSRPRPRTAPGSATRGRGGFSRGSRAARGSWPRLTRTQSASVTERPMPCSQWISTRSPRSRWRLAKATPSPSIAGETAQWSSVGRCRNESPWRSSTTASSQASTLRSTTALIRSSRARTSASAARKLPPIARSSVIQLRFNGVAITGCAPPDPAGRGANRSGCCRRHRSRRFAPTVRPRRHLSRRRRQTSGSSP